MHYSATGLIWTERQHGPFDPGNAGSIKSRDPKADRHKRVKFFKGLFSSYSWEWAIHQSRRFFVLYRWKRCCLRSVCAAVKSADTRAQDLSHISPVMSVPLLVGHMSQWLRFRPGRVYKQLVAWLSPGISRVTSVAGSALFPQRAHHEWIMKSLFLCTRHVWYIYQKAN